MKKVFLILLLGTSLFSFSKKRLSKKLNTATERELAPSISVDNRTLLFLRVYKMGGLYKLNQVQQLQNDV